jgi:hypothetical protein
MKNLEEASNSDLLYHIKRTALSSVYWSKKALSYHLIEVYEYAPMIEDELYCSLFDEKDIIGVYDMERALGRKIAVEELIVCPLSVNYLVFGEPVLTGSDKERGKLFGFYGTVKNGIKRGEKKAIGYELKRLNKLY